MVYKIDSIKKFAIDNIWKKNLKQIIKQFKMDDL